MSDKAGLTPGLPALVKDARKNVLLGRYENALQKYNQALKIIAPHKKEGADPTTIDAWAQVDQELRVEIQMATQIYKELKSIYSDRTSPAASNPSAGKGEHRLEPARPELKPRAQSPRVDVRGNEWRAPEHNGNPANPALPVREPKPPGGHPTAEDKKGPQPPSQPRPPGYGRDGGKKPNPVQHGNKSSNDK